MKTRTLRLRSSFALIGAFALAATACGGGDTGDQAVEDTQQDDMATEQMATEPAAGEASPAGGEAAAELPTETFGPACSQVPAEGEGSAQGMADDPVATAASNNPLLSTLTQAVQQAGLVDTLNSAENLTVFAPVNSAFEAIPSDMMNQVMNDKELLTSILLTHVHQGEQFNAQELADQGSVQTLNEQAGPLEVTTATDTLQVEAPGSTAMVICGNVQTANATVHLIDTVLLPQEMGGGGATESPTESNS